MNRFSLALLVAFSGCATVLTSADMSTRRGTGTRRAIAGPAEEITQAFVENVTSAGYNVERAGDAVYASHSAGVNIALFQAPAAGGQEVEIVYASSMLGADSKKFEASTLEMLAGKLALKAQEARGPLSAVPAQVAAPRAGADAPSFRLPEDETKFALVIGIESYQSVPKAEHSVRDAEAVKAYLLAAGYPERNIVFLTDQSAGKAALEKYLEAWLPRNIDERSTVFVYFSGHGAPEATKGEAYLMPWDGDAKFVETTGYPIKRLYARLNALKARRVAVAMDTCFSGAGGRSVLGKGLRPLVARVEGVPVGRVSGLTAAAWDEVTGTDEASRHGLFTYHFLRAMNAQGGKGTLKELFESLSPKVRDAARRDNRDQTPQLIGDGSVGL